MATKKAATRKPAAATPANQDAMLPLVRMIGHTARMNLAVSQSPTKQTHKARGYDVIIKDYKGRWAAVSPADKKTAVALAHQYAALEPDDINAAVAALEG